MTIDRPGPRYSEFLSRVRARPLSSWQLPGRATAVRAAIEDLNLLAWGAANRPGSPPTVPDLGLHVVADQLQVLVDDAVDSGVAADRIDAVLAPLADALSVRLH